MGSPPTPKTPFIEDADIAARDPAKFPANPNRSAAEVWAINFTVRQRLPEAF
ncbi:MAG: hypothetical protein AAF722_16240 [Cyanobacteria bacterium P01_C01_bin.70]